MTTVTCPICHKPAQEQSTRWGVKHQCCGLWSWDGKPLTDRDTHEARKAAHEAFDQVWKNKRERRGQAYKKLALQLGMKSEECHMATMTADQARSVVVAVKEIWPCPKPRA